MGIRRTCPILLLLASLVVFHGLDDASVPFSSVLGRHIPRFASIHESPTKAILRFGRENKIPLGLVVSPELCESEPVDLALEEVTVREVLDRLTKGVPSYTWHLQDGVVVFAPANRSPVTARFLSLRIAPYTIAKDTLEAQATYAWMNIRATLRPQEGTAFSILSSPDAVKYPELKLGAVSVEKMLNSLVGRNDGGAWILFPFSKFEELANSRPFEVAGYSNSWPPALASPCDQIGRRGWE